MYSKIQGPQSLSKRIMQNDIYTKLRCVTGVLTTLLTAFTAKNTSIPSTMRCAQWMLTQSRTLRPNRRRTIYTAREPSTQIQPLHRAQQFCVTINSAYNKQLNRTVSRVAYQLRARRSPLSLQTRTTRALWWGKLSQPMRFICTCR